MDERRRGPRVAGQFYVRIEGLDTDAALVTGDLSTSGISFARATAVGDAGVLEPLTIVSKDRSLGVRVLARLVSHVPRTDRTTGVRRLMIAFEFYPDSPEVVGRLRALFQHVVQERAAERSLAIDTRLGVNLFGGAAGPQAGTVFRLEINHMLVETSWPIAIGDKVQMAFQSVAGGPKIPFEGIATQVARNKSGSYNAEVTLEPAAITESIDLLFSTSDLESSDLKKKNQHLIGRIDRIALTSLFSLFEMEKMSGELDLHSSFKEYKLFWSVGRLVDLDPDHGCAPRDVLAQILLWKTGTFRFVRTEVDRFDRFNASVTALLLDLARAADEAGR